MSRHFSGVSSSILTIEDWWPDPVGFHDYLEVGIQITLSHESDYDNGLKIHGGPVSLAHCSAYGWNIGTILMYDEWGDLLRSWRSNSGTTMAAFQSFGERLPNNQVYTYTGIGYKGSGGNNTTFHCAGSISPAVPGASYSAPPSGNTIKSNGLPWYFWNDKDSASIDAYGTGFIGGRTLIIDPRYADFHGELISINTWIVRGDGSRWTSVKSFTGTDDDLLAPFGPLVLTAASYAPFDTRRRLYAPIVLSATSDPAYPTFDTRRKLYAPIHLRADTDPPYPIFDTRRRLGANIKSLALPPFDTRRRLGGNIKKLSLQPFDTRRRCCKSIVSYHDTRRKFIAAIATIPVDTLR